MLYGFNMVSEMSKDNIHDIDITLVNGKGGIVIPSHIREKYDITPGIKVYWRTGHNGEIIVGKLDDLLKKANNNNGEGQHTQHNPISPTTKKTDNGETEKNV